MELLKNFNGLTMQVFKKGKEVFSGRYSKQSDFEYVPIYTTKTKSVRVSEEPLIKESVCTCRCFYKCYKRMYQVFSGIFVLYLFIWMILSFCELSEIIWPATVLFMVLFSIFTFCTFGFIFLHYVRDECALYWSNELSLILNVCFPHSPLWLLSKVWKHTASFCIHHILVKDLRRKRIEQTKSSDNRSFEGKSLTQQRINIILSTIEDIQNPKMKTLSCCATCIHINPSRMLIKNKLPHFVQTTKSGNGTTSSLFIHTCCTKNYFSFTGPLSTSLKFLLFFFTLFLEVIANIYCLL